MFISESLNIVSPEQVVTEVKEVLDGFVCSAVPISFLYDLENDKEELQGIQSINYMGLHRNMKHGVQWQSEYCLYIRYIQLF
jgi:hypothetical protein